MKWLTHPTKITMALAMFFIFASVNIYNYSVDSQKLKLLYIKYFYDIIICNIQLYGLHIFVRLRTNMHGNILHMRIYYIVTCAATVCIATYIHRYMYKGSYIASYVISIHKAIVVMYYVYMVHNYVCICSYTCTYVCNIHIYT